MAKIEVSGGENSRSYERSEIQAHLGPAVEAKLTEMGIPTGEMDISHVRRTARSLLRLAADLIQKHGGPPQAFIQFAIEAYVKELGIEGQATPDQVGEALQAKALASKPKAQA
jgi:hypothetical protein